MTSNSFQRTLAYLKALRIPSILLLLVLFHLTLLAQWTEIASPIEARYEGPSVVKDGKIYVFGGFGPNYSLSNSVEMYDPGSDNWSIVSYMPVEVTHIGVAIVYNNEVWIAGGRLWNDEQVKTVQIYNIATNSWSFGPDLPEARGGGGLAFLNNKLHYIGGFGPKPAVDDKDDHWVLDLGNQGAGWQSAADMPLERHHFGLAVINGKIYVAGGQEDHDNTAKDKDFVHEYNPDNNTWTQKADMPGVNSHIEPGAFAYNGKMVTVGGENIRDKILEYDPNSNDWDEKMTLPLGLLAPSSKIINGKIYVSHGATGGGNGVPTVPTQKNFVSDYNGGVPSNNPPSFNIQGDQTAANNSGSQTVFNFAYNIDDGDGGTQTLTFFVNSSNPGIFNVQPAINPSNGNLTFTPQPGTIGTSTITVSLNDGFSTSPSQTFTITITGNGGGTPGSVLYRINAGGGELGDTPINWQEDKATNPVPYVNSDESNNTAGFDGFGGTNNTDVPEDLFGSRRWDGPWNDEMRWEFPVLSGDYEVRLYFVEDDPDNTAGIRIFDVEIEGVVSIDNLDLFAVGGHNNAIQQTVFTTVTDGTLDIDLVRDPFSSDDPQISGIQIIASDGVIFPVEFTSFEANLIGKNVYLSWNTAREENLATFTVEKSLDGILFEKIADVPIKGGQGPNAYEFGDKLSLLAKTFYRIKAVDIDGTITYSNLRSVNPTTTFVQINPNPIRDWMHLKLRGTNGPAQIELRTVGGQLVLQRTESLDGNIQKFQYSMKDVSPGIYLLSISQNGIKQIQKVFVR